MEVKFEGKRALVTGAARGLGREIVKGLDRCGAQVLAIDINEEGLQTLNKEVPGVITAVADLSDWGATRRNVQELGPIHLLVNNAGLLIRSPFLDMSEEAVNTLFDVNIKSVINISQIVARGMVSRGDGGAIVHISSKASVTPGKGLSVYGASKAALDALCRGMALELGPHKIRVNTIQPFTMRTELSKEMWTDPDNLQSQLDKIPMGKLPEVEDVVNSVLFLLSDKSSMTSGVTLPINGGYC